MLLEDVVFFSKTSRSIQEFSKHFIPLVSSLKSDKKDIESMASSPSIQLFDNYTDPIELSNVFIREMWPTVYVNLK